MKGAKYSANADTVLFLLRRTKKERELPEMAANRVPRRMVAFANSSKCQAYRANWALSNTFSFFFSLVREVFVYILAIN